MIRGLLEITTKLNIKLNQLRKHSYDKLLLALWINLLASNLYSVVGYEVEVSLKIENMFLTH